MKGGPLMDRQERRFFRLLLWGPVLAVLLLIAVLQLWGPVQNAFDGHWAAAHAEELTALAEQALDRAEAGETPPGWTENGKVRLYPGEGLVVWETHAFGLAPAGEAWGYYYAADGEAHSLPGFDDTRSRPVADGIYTFRARW